MGIARWFSGLFSRKKPQVSDDSKPMVSLVLLLPRAIRFNKETVHQLISKTLEITFDPNDDSSQYFVAGDEPPFIVKLAESVFILHSMQRPYFDENPESELDEMRLNRLISEHKAWASFDRLGDEPDETCAYQMIGKVIAGIVERLPFPCALLGPGNGSITVYKPEMLPILRSNDPLAVFRFSAGYVPIIAVSEDDPIMREAVQKAKQSLPEFIAAYESRTENLTFAVKASFQDGDAEEFMWAGVTALENGRIYGRLDNDPDQVKNVKCGDVVRLEEKNIIDWVITGGEELRGGFTINAIEKIREQRKH